MARDKSDKHRVDYDPPEEGVNDVHAGEDTSIIGAQYAPENQGA